MAAKDIKAAGGALVFPGELRKHAIAAGNKL